MAEGPMQYNPNDGGEPVVAWQVRPDTWVAVAKWCHGVMIASDPNQPGSQAVMLGDLEHVASLGYWVVRTEAGEFSPWEPSLFQSTHTAVES